MPQNNPQAEKSTTPDLFPAGLAEAGMKRFEDVMSLQKELVTYLQDVNRNWFEHMQSEGTMTSEFANMLTAARSIPTWLLPGRNGRTGGWSCSPKTAATFLLTPRGSWRREPVSSPMVG